jgi:hypothetical protein
MAVLELTDWQPLDLVFSRGETPSLRVSFTGVAEATVAGWDITCPVWRSTLTEPLAEFDVTVVGTDVVFTLDDTVTATLPDQTSWAMRIAWGPDTVRLPLGGRLLLRTDDC